MRLHHAFPICLTKASARLSVQSRAQELHSQAQSRKGTSMKEWSTFALVIQSVLSWRSAGAVETAEPIVLVPPTMVIFMRPPLCSRAHLRRQARPLQGERLRRARSIAGRGPRWREVDRPHPMRRGRRPQ